MAEPKDATAATRAANAALLAALPAEDGADARNQFAKSEGLGDIIVSAGFERAHLVFLSVPNGDHDDTGMRGDGSDFPASVQTIQPGHIDIQ